MIAAPSAAADITSTAREKPCCARTWPADVMTSTSRAPASFTNLTSGSSVQVSTARVVIALPPPPAADRGEPVPHYRQATTPRTQAFPPVSQPPGERLTHPGYDTTGRPR